MTSIEFIYWLQGYLEVADPEFLTPQQTKKIKDKLATCFQKETPKVARGMLPDERTKTVAESLLEYETYSIPSAPLSPSWTLTGKFPDFPSALVGSSTQLISC